MLKTVILYKELSVVAKNDKEKQAQDAWADKKTSQPRTNSGCSNWIGQSSSKTRSESFRTCGTDWETDYSIARAILFSGGILRQLIQQTKDRLAEADACIVWYEEEKQKLQRYLAELEGLAEQDPENPHDKTEEE